jgi:signal peptidase
MIIAGYQPSTERSNSMAPVLHRGDVLISRAIQPTEAHAGDIITFAAPRLEGVRLTHRVRSVHAMDDGRVAFVTRGDANVGTERWTIARDGQLTRLETRIPGVGLALIAIDSHPVYLAIAIALALWLAMLHVVWGRGRIRPPRPESGRPRARRTRRRISLVGVGALVVAGVSGSALAAIVVADDPAIPSAALVVNDGGQPLFTLLDMTPGDTATACELVTNTGPDPADVGMYGLTTGTGLDNYLALQITRGTLPAGTPAASCTGFDADSNDYMANGAGVVYSGMLSDLPTTENTALGDPVPAWAAGGAVAYRMTIELIDSNSAQSTNATQHFYFGVIATQATTDPTTTPTTTPALPTVPATTVPTTTTPTAPDPSTPPIPARGVVFNSDTVTRKGLLRLGITAYGKGKLSAKVYLYPKAKAPKGKKRKLILLGKTTMLSSRVGSVYLTIRPKPAVLERYRSHRSSYRLRVVLTATYTKTTKAYVTRSFVSQKSARQLARLGKAR